LLSLATLIFALTMTFYNRGDLYSAVVRGDLKKVKRFVKRGDDVNMVDDRGQSPLHRIAGGGLILMKPKSFLRKAPACGFLVDPNICFEIAQILIDHGADINAKDYRGQTPLHFTGRSKNYKVARLLVKSGADVNAKDNYERTPLLYAVGSGSAGFGKKVPEVLIESGADLTPKNQFGDTALHCATMWLGFSDDYEIVELLLTKGADVNSKDNDGDTPLHTLIQWARDTEDFQNELIQWAGDTEDFQKENFLPIVKLLLENGADVNIKNNRDKTPLDYVESEELIELLKNYDAKGQKARDEEKVSGQSGDVQNQTIEDSNVPFPCWEQSWRCGKWRTFNYTLNDKEFLVRRVPEQETLLLSTCSHCSSFRLVNPYEMTERIILSSRAKVKQCEHEWRPAFHYSSFEQIELYDIFFVVYDGRMYAIYLEEIFGDPFPNGNIVYQIAEVTGPENLPEEVAWKELKWEVHEAEGELPVADRTITFFTKSILVDNNRKIEKYVSIAYDNPYGGKMTEKNQPDAHIAIVHNSYLINNPVVDLRKFRFKTWEDGLGNRCEEEKNE